VVLETRAVADFKRAAIDTVMVPGSFSIADVLPESRSLMQWLRRISTSTRRITSVCSGAFLMAQAGLLRGKRVATHWLMCDKLQDRFPDVEVVVMPSSSVKGPCGRQRA